THRVEGFQATDLLTLAGNVDGLQLAAIDVASDVRDLQIRAVNVGRKVNGMQIGVVNVSREIHDGALGLVNIAGNGSIAPALWGSGPNGSLNVGLKFHTDYTYALAGVGSNPSGDRFRYELGFGAHVPIGPVFFGELGASYGEAGSRVSDRVHADRSELRIRVTLGAHPLPWLEPFAAAGLVTR